MTEPNDEQREQLPDTEADREPELNAEVIRDLEAPNDDADIVRGGGCAPGAARAHGPRGAARGGISMTH